MSVAPPWEDFELEKNKLRFNTVAKLQTIINGWADQCRALLTKSGKKQDLIDRMARQLDQWREQNNVDKWLKAKAVLDQVKETGQYNHSAMSSEAIQPQSFASTSKLAKNIPYPTPGNLSSHVRYDTYNTGKKSTTTNAAGAPVKPSIRFKSSPFFRVDQIVSDVIECPESLSANDRKAQTLSFMLTNEHLAKLQSPGSRHQLRLFCTSSSWHNLHNTAFRTESPCPIEFPPTCEVRVNGSQINSNLKGIKKKPGTAPPADLGNAVRLNTQVPNRVEMVYVNSQQPVQNKKFYMTVILVETKTVDQLVENLKKGKYKSEEDIRAKMIQDTAIDDEIIAGSQKMTLKCPLTCVRVNIPCRSIQCPHAQCFDATSWFSMMEQITTWLCPVCDRTLNVDELIIDGYFDHILKATPDNVEDVIVEADGEWHTSDNKFASERWRKSHPTIDSLTPPMSKSETPKARGPKSETSSQQSKPSLPPQEVIDLSDSDDDQVKRELSPSGGARMLVKRTNTTDVIDLTIDDDDSDGERSAPVSPNNLKRKETSLPESVPVWKKARIGTPQSQAQSTSSPVIQTAAPPSVAAYSTFPAPTTKGILLLNPRTSLGNGNQVPYGSTSTPGSTTWHARHPLLTPSYEANYPSHLPIRPPLTTQPSHTSLPHRPHPTTQSTHTPLPPQPPSSTQSPRTPLPALPTRTPSSGPTAPTTAANGTYRHYTPTPLPPLPAPTYFGNPYQQSPTRR